MNNEWFQAFQERLFAPAKKALEPFEFPALPDASHFRILALEPLEANALLSCQLRIVSLQNARQSGYEALSYAWGNQSDPPKSFVSCHGKCLTLTSSLESALCHIRSEEKVITLWVDQICINQEDLVERSQQVSLMRSIYSAAKRVIIWLGDRDEASYQAMTFAPVIYYASCQHPETQGHKFIHAQGYGQQLAGTDLVFPSFDSPHWAALTHLLSRGWFQRVWVAQEAIANPETIVSCGNDRIPWAVVTNLLHLLDTRTHATQLLRGNCEASDSISFLGTLRASASASSDLRSQDLLTVIKAFSQQLATDPRDHVFAVLGFVQDFRGVSVAPSYELDVNHIFLDLACQCLQNGYGLEVLYYANMADDGTRRELPSWVPDWRYQPHERTIGSKMIQRSMFRAASSKKANWALDAPREMLTVRGRRICVVTDQGVLYPSKESYLASKPEDGIQMNSIMNQSLIHYYFFQKAVYMAKGAAGNGRNWEEVLCRVLTRDYWGVSCGFSKALEILGLLRALATSVHAMFEAYCALPRGSYMQEHFMDHGDPTVVDWHEKHFRHMWPLWEAGRPLANNSEVANQVFVQQLTGNRVVNTNMKMLANVPEHTKEDDQIWIIHGGSTPFLLRPTERGYVMVGACFVDGIMNGQALMQNLGVEENASLV